MSKSRRYDGKYKIQGYIEKAGTKRWLVYQFGEVSDSRVIKVKKLKATIIASLVEASPIGILTDIPVEHGDIENLGAAEQKLWLGADNDPFFLSTSPRVLFVARVNNLVGERTIEVEITDKWIYDSLYFFLPGNSSMSISHWEIEYEVVSKPNPLLVALLMNEAIESLREHKIMQYDDAGGESPSG